MNINKDIEKLKLEELQKQKIIFEINELKKNKWLKPDFLKSSFMLLITIIVGIMPNNNILNKL